MSLYKYLTSERIDVLRDHRIRFSQIKALNDSFEMKPYYERIASNEALTEILTSNEEAQNIGFDFAYDLIDALFERAKAIAPQLSEEITKVRQEIPERELFLEQIKSDYPNLIESEVLPVQIEHMSEIRLYVFEQFNEKMGILCLSENPNSELMWAHYTQASQGFVLEFDENHEFFTTPENEGGITGVIQKVDYLDERPKKEKLTELTPTDFIFCKSRSWAYENEWRIIKTLCEETLSKNADNEPILDESEQPIHLFSFPLEALKGVIFGSRMSEAKKQPFLEILSLEEYQHIKIFQAIDDEKDYKINIEAF